MRELFKRVCKKKKNGNISLWFIFFGFDSALGFHVRLVLKVYVCNYHSTATIITILIYRG